MTEDKKEIFGLGKQKVLEEFTPDKKYISLLITGLTLIFLVAIGSIYGIIAGIISENLSGTDFIHAIVIVAYVLAGVGLFVYIVGIIFIFPYYNSLNYTFTTQEIVVNKGFLVKRTKIVPYRNITNFVMRRGILDRLIGGSNFGSIQIETAGQGPQQGHPEQRLVGILDVSGYTEKIRGILAKMKGQAALSADMETASSLDEEDLLVNILEVLKEIKNKL
ncbi:MAG TPA: PH domain-containing protein [Candidatus Bathyarchaeia archaeon]|nr:PH domain-containing protein [Candidatus Bathyarchaeia archaeon]